MCPVAVIHTACRERACRRGQQDPETKGADKAVNRNSAVPSGHCPAGGGWPSREPLTAALTIEHCPPLPYRCRAGLRWRCGVGRPYLSRLTMIEQSIPWSRLISGRGQQASGCCPGQGHCAVIDADGAQTCQARPGGRRARGSAQRPGLLQRHRTVDFQRPTRATVNAGLGETSCEPARRRRCRWRPSSHARPSRPECATCTVRPTVRFRR
jgi:hypothetical protein